MRNGGREAARGGLRVLLVEDAPDIREVFTVLLRADGFDVVATDSGRGRRSSPPPGGGRA
jgi:CheY-like chemotaxis protein